MQRKNTGYTARNINKTLEVLEKLAESTEPITLPSLAAKIGLTRGQTSILLNTLTEKGLVECESVSGGYQLGAYTVALGQKLLESSNLASYVRPIMQKLVDSSNIVSYSHPIIEELVRKHGEAVYMTVIKDNEVLFLNMVDCVQQLRTEPFVGRKLPFFTNAAGKVMKAVDSWDLLEKLCKKEPRPDRRPDMDKLASEMKEIRITGVAVENGGLGEGVISVAVAVRDYAGKVVGALTMLGPSVRMLAERIDNEIIPSLQEGADLLSKRFGYAPG